MKAPWWADRRSLVLAMLLATSPLWFVSLPPLIDLLGHMGRYDIQLHRADVPALQLNWAFHWQLIGNLGCDLVMEVLGRLFGVERGTVVLAALLVPLMMWGQVRLAHAVHGQIPATLWAAFPFAMAYPWHYGLANYWLGVALALYAAAWAIVARPSVRRTLLLLPLGVALWTAHIFGWAVFAVLVWSHAVTRGGWRDGPLATLRLWPLAGPLLLTLILAYGQEGGHAETLGWFEWATKLRVALYTLRDESIWLDLASIAGALGLILWGFTDRKRFAVAPALALASAIMVIAIALVPRQLFGSAFADGRIWPLAFMFALLALRPRIGSAPIATAAMALFAVRTAVTLSGFLAYDTTYARHLRALDAMPRGARVAVFTRFPCEAQVPWRRSRIEHLDGIAIVRRDVFTNGQWDVPGAQLLTPLGARGTWANADPSQLVRDRLCPPDLRPALALRIAALPRDRFDMVWVTGFLPQTLPRVSGLTPVFADDETILYRIAK